MDGSENVYVAGHSFATWGSPVNPHAGNLDAFAAKLLVPPATPTMTGWGMIIFCVVLVGSAVWVMRRRTIYRSV